MFVIFACASKKVSCCRQIDPKSLAYEEHGTRHEKLATAVVAGGHSAMYGVEDACRA